MAEQLCFKSEFVNDFIDKTFGDIRAPFTAGIELTAKCNLNCIHCYAKPGRSHEDMTFEEYKAVFDKLIEHGLLDVYFTGGEIFTRPDFADIYLYAKKKGVLVSLLTNITLLTDKLINLFKEYPPEIISTTMYGYDKNTYERVTGVSGSYDQFMEALDKLIANEIPFELKYVAMEKTMKMFIK